MLRAINRLLRGSSAKSRGADVQALIVGLGNPGDQYCANRHNIGFMAVDRLCERCESASFRNKFQGLFLKSAIVNHQVILLKPQTFMNRSGRAVQEAMHFFNLPLANLVVVHDELDLEFGVARIKVGGGAAGHNGIKSVIQECGSNEFVRLRIGIGRPQGVKGEHYVLSDFSKSEQAQLPQILENAAEALEAIVTEGSPSAMNRFNARAASRPTS